MRKNNNIEMFPSVCENISKPDMTMKKYMYCYPILLKCFTNLKQNKSIANIALDMGIQRLGLYAVNEFMDYVLDDENSGRFIDVRLYDRDAYRYRSGHEGKAVGDIQKLLDDYKAREIDKIIVCNLTYGNEIAKDLVKQGIDNNDLIVLDALIYSL